MQANNSGRYDSRSRSMRSAHLGYHPYCAQQDREIAQQRPFPDVARLERDPLLEIGDLVAAVDLPWPRNTRLDVKPRVMVLLVQRNLGGKRWAGAYQGHIAAQHIHQLGQLVQTGTPEELADPGHARIVADLEETGIDRKSGRVGKECRSRWSP